jgi:hypothetical protein
MGAAMTRLLVALLFLPAAQDPLAGWSPLPAEFAGAKVEGGRVSLSAPKWSFLAAPDEIENAELAASLTIEEPSRETGFFGQHWSVWPDLTYSDGGYDAGFLLRGGYRVQLSHRQQEVALVKVPEGGYLRVAPCAVKLKASHEVKVTAQGAMILVTVDGQEKIRFVDRVRRLGKGRAGLGASGNAKVSFEKVSLRPLASADAPAETPHVPDFRERKWLGGRSWIFDGQEPILLLPASEATYINNVKLRPGWKPLLSWNSHWDVQTQGAFKEADNRMESIAVEGGGASIRASWSFRHVKDRFVVRSGMTVGWDARRQCYTYDVESGLEVLPGEPFHFRYGYDFEHHTPLDPFRWQYLVVRRDGGEIAHRPVYPIDPGVMDGVAQSGGARVWYGRHNDDLVVAPAVEYDLPEPGKRKLSTAVCAAFYDTGVAFGQESAPAGTKVRVKYRYTGWPAAEAEAIFKASKAYDSLMLDPEHHYLFADEWPKLTFRDAVPMSRTWSYGRRPFMTGHNQRPTYALAKDTGVGSGFGMRCGPGASGRATLAAPSPLPAGRWIVRALVRSENAHGPGGRIEISAVDPKEGKSLRQDTHHVGNGTFAWKAVAFATEVPSGAPGLAVAFGNAGTGDVTFAEVEFVRLEDGAPLPAGVIPAANGTAPKLPPAPAGALADYRMEEGRGQHVLDFAGGPFGKLELANLDWTVDEGRPALRFASNAAGRKEYPRAGSLDRGYLGTTGYAERRTVPVALAGFHGGGLEIKGLTIAAWIKPDARLEKGHRGDVAGVGARRFILGLEGEKAPYRLSVRVNVNDTTSSDAVVEAGRWQHVAMTCEPAEGQWRVRLWLDGRAVGEGATKKFPSPASIPPSIVLGTEIFYFHDAYYRGLIGRTVVLDHPASPDELKTLAGR